MSTPPPLLPLLRDQRPIDAQHLRLLVIFHYIVAGFSVFGLVFLALHYAFLHAILANPTMWKDAKGGPPPVQMFAVFRWFYVVLGVLLVFGGVLNLLSALFLRRRRHRTFSLVVAGLDCFQFPLGTALGVFTIVVLIRPSVEELYSSPPA